MRRGNTTKLIFFLFPGAHPLYWLDNTDSFFLFFRVTLIYVHAPIMIIIAAYKDTHFPYQAHLHTYISTEFSFISESINFLRLNGIERIELENKLVYECANMLLAASFKWIMNKIWIVSGGDREIKKLSCRIQNRIFSHRKCRRRSRFHCAQNGDLFCVNIRAPGEVLLCRKKGKLADGH